MFSNLWVTHLAGIGFYFVVIVTILLQLLLCAWMGLSFFGGFLCLPVDGCSTTSCNFGALAGEDECTSFCSAILNQSSFPTFCHLVDSYSAFKLKLKPPLSPKYRTSCSHPAYLTAHCTCPPKSRNLEQGTVSSLKALIVSYPSLPLQCLYKGHCIF